MIKCVFFIITSFCLTITRYILHKLPVKSSMFIFILFLFHSLHFNPYLLWLFNVQLIQVSLGWFVLPPVIEDGVLLGHLPLVVLHIVPVEDGQGDGQGAGDDQEGHKDWADVC